MANSIEVDVSLETNQAIAALKKLDRSIGNFEKATTASMNNATGAFDVFKGVLGAQAVIGSLSALKNAAVGAFSSMVDQAKDLEQIETRFKVLTGSTENAKAILADLQNFAATTPFQLPGLANASASLLAFGNTQEEVIPLLQNLGDVAAGAGADINELTQIFGQVQAAGKLTGERFLQLQERAIPIGPAIAQTMGVAESAVKDLISKGKVDVATFEAAFASLSAQGGQFAGGMIEQSKTLGGVLSTLGDNVSLLQSDFGSELLPSVKNVSNALIGMIQANRDLAKSFAIETGEAFTAVLQALQNVFKNLTGGMSGADMATNIFTASLNVIVDVLQVATGAFEALSFVVSSVQVLWNQLQAAAGLLGEGVLFLVEKILQARLAFEEMTGANTENTKMLLTNLEEAKAKTAEFTDAQLGEAQKVIDSDKARRGSLEQFRADLEKAKTSETEIIANQNQIQIENERAKDEAITANKQTEEEKRSAMEAERAEAQKAAEEQKFQEKLAKQKEQNDILAEQVALAREEARLIKEEQDLLESDKDFAFLEEKLGREEALKEQARTQALINEGANAEAIRKSKLQSQKKGFDAEKKIEAQRIEFHKLTFAQQIQAAQGTAKLLTQVTANAAGDQAGITKRVRQVEAIINGASAVQQALNAPFPLNIINAGLVTALTLQNIRKIESTPVPSFQEGGFVPGNQFTGDNVRANVNSGEAILNPAQQREFLAIANGEGGSRGSLVINIEGNVIANDEEQIQNLVDRLNDSIEFNNVQLAV